MHFSGSFPYLSGCWTPTTSMASSPPPSAISKLCRHCKAVALVTLCPHLRLSSEEVPLVTVNACDSSLLARGLSSRVHRVCQSNPVSRSAQFCATFCYDCVWLLLFFMNSDALSVAPVCHFPHSAESATTVACEQNKQILPKILECLSSTRTEAIPSGTLLVACLPAGI